MNKLLKAKENEITETDEIAETDKAFEIDDYETPISPSSPRFEMPKIPEGYVMDEEVTREILSCKDRNDLKKLLCKYKEKALNATMKCDPKFATSTIFVTDQDYEFSINPELITLVESDPFHGYETETFSGTPYKAE